MLGFGDGGGGGGGAAEFCFTINVIASVFLLFWIEVQISGCCVLLASFQVFTHHLYSTFNNLTSCFISFYLNKL